MTLKDFQDSLDDESPPDSLSPLLKALWWDANNDWEKAHHLAQENSSKDGSWIHAYLHRKEGDQFNSNYWYSRAGKSSPDLSLDAERKHIVETLLKQH